MEFPLNCCLEKSGLAPSQYSNLLLQPSSREAANDYYYTTTIAAWCFPGDAVLCNVFADLYQIHQVL